VNVNHHFWRRFRDRFLLAIKDMAKTEFWKQFGETILQSPHLTLAAFLGHHQSIAVAKKHSIHFPTTADFQIDPAYDPNVRKLDLDDESVESTFFILCISAWGAEALMHAVNACSHLQCMYHFSCSTKFKSLRNDAAFTLQTLIDMPTAEVRQKATDLLRQCQNVYRPHESDPDSEAAHIAWFHLGAPWFGLETALGNLGVRNDCGETEPAPSNSTWCARKTVWPDRAIDAAAHWSSHAMVRATIRSTLIAWAVNHYETRKC
jgi:hypothetical protein